MGKETTTSFPGSEGVGHIGSLGIAMIGILALAGCSSERDENQRDGETQADSDAATPSKITYMDQGWSPEIRESFYYTPQGSHLMPYRWFLALEQADSVQLFSSPDNMARYGYLLPLDGPSSMNPDDLPVGFVREPNNNSPGEPSLGMTCAACHTNDISVKGHTLRIDGAPSLSDLQTFLIELTAAVVKTRENPQKFSRFAATLLGNASDKTARSTLRQALGDFSKVMEKDTRMRTYEDSAGPGRIDALGQIINVLAVTNIHEPANFQTLSAPVSYPFLWYAPQQEWVQWAPIAGNPLARNVGEALGVFGQADFSVEGNQRFASSANIKNLYDMEKWMEYLEPPTWQNDIFGAPDPDLIAKGAKLFEDHCVACHNMPPFKMSPKGKYIAPDKQFIEIVAVPAEEIKTDQQYTINLVKRAVKTGPLAEILFDEKPEVPSAEYFSDTVGAVVATGLKSLQLTPEENLDYSGYRFHPLQAGQTSLRSVSAPTKHAVSLKAGPLVGIWATGPFLHNGSVPNIYELLSAPEARSDVFWVGNRELDTEKLGFVSKEEQGLFKFDTADIGNGNGGHAYPKNGLTEAEKMALIEFLKNPPPLLRQGNLND